MKDRALRTFVTNPLIHIHQKEIGSEIAVKISSVNRPERINLSFRFNQSSDCSMIQDEVYTALLGTSRPDHVASFGNSDVKNAADWVEIINNKPANQVDFKIHFHDIELVGSWQPDIIILFRLLLALCLSDRQI